MNALTRTFSDLTDALTKAKADINRRAPVVLAEARAAEKAAALDEAVINRLTTQPWRIALIVYGGPTSWPAVRSSHVLTTEDVLTDCRRMIRGQRQAAATGHYAFDRNKLIGLEQAEAALTRMINRENDNV
ncbi:hypothetical protein [Bauldia litoralis]|uniref:hypothetical protein n=1 Tax=Bauldia litoralis TaxID=665467 RepID=UPI003262E18C